MYMCAYVQIRVHGDSVCWRNMIMLILALWLSGKLVDFSKWNSSLWNACDPSHLVERLYIIYYILYYNYYII